MSDNTLRGRLFEAPYHVNALLAFAFPSNALSTRQRVILIQTRHSAPDLGINLPIALTQYLQNDLLVSC